MGIYINENYDLVYGEDDDYYYDDETATRDEYLRELGYDSRADELSDIYE